MKKSNYSRREVLKAGGSLAAATATLTLPAIGTVEAVQEGLPRWAMVIDLRKCIGCRACTVACKSEYDTALDRWNAVVKQIEFGKYPNVKKVFLPRLCNHCSGGDEEVPPCIKECPEYPGERRKLITRDGKKHRYRGGATYKRPDGMILLDNSRCTGCGKCIKACPYGVRSFNPRIKAGKDSTKSGITKCTFCQHRVDKGLVPSCVNTCIGRARIFGDLNDADSQVSKLVKEFKLLEKKKDVTLLPKEGTDPHVFYIDPYNVLKKYTIDPERKSEEFRDQLV